MLRLFIIYKLRRLRLPFQQLQTQTHFGKLHTFLVGMRWQNYSVCKYGKKLANNAKFERILVPYSILQVVSLMYSYVNLAAMLWSVLFAELWATASAVANVLNWWKNSFTVNYSLIFHFRSIWKEYLTTASCKTTDSTWLRIRYGI